MIKFFSNKNVILLKYALNWGIATMFLLFDKMRKMSCIEQSKQGVGVFM